MEAKYTRVIVWEQEELVTWKHTFTPMGDLVFGGWGGRSEPTQTQGEQANSNTFNTLVSPSSSPV